ncbi:unnamed protein product [Heterobilharzia americana]|nr:unnamed protein product [Heterobilharzia americana]
MTSKSNDDFGRLEERMNECSFVRYNIYRRYAVVERVVQARQPQQDLQVEQGSSSHRGSEHAESDNQQNHVSQESTSSESQLRTDLPFEQEPRLTRITTNLRSVANTSYQFFSALISSIIPEQQPPLHLD